MAIWQAGERGGRQESHPGIAARYRDGLHLPEPDLWLDPHGSRESAFVSHAHADHFARHRGILCSRATRDLIAARYGIAEGCKVRAVPFGEVFALSPGFSAALIPAGHVFGSAQIRVVRESDGASLLYTGDFKLRAGLSAEPCEAAPADTLIMETTFGLPRFQFPPTHEIIADIVEFAREAVADGDVPVLLGYSLGKAQEILRALAGAGLPVMLHPAVDKMTAVYRALHPEVDVPAYRPFDADEFVGHALIFPPGAARSQVIRRIKNRRVAMMTGWAMTPGAKFRYQVDEVFPLSDHADYPDLLRYVGLVGPKRVLTLHGFAAEFARDLRARGIEAWSLLGDDQLELGFAGAPPTSTDGAPPLPPPPASGFGDFVAVAESIAATPGKLKKIALLGDYLGGLPDDADLARAVTFLTGRPFARAGQGGSALNAGRAVVRRALLEASGVPEERYREISGAQNDAGRTAYLVLGHRPGGEGRTLDEIAGFFAAVRDARSPLAKGDLVRDLLAALHRATVSSSSRSSPATFASG